MKPIYFIYGFTAYSTVQLIGFLGISYKILEIPMFIIFCALILAALILGIAEWTKAQSKQSVTLNRAQILSTFSGSFTIIGFVLFALFVGVWIGL